MGHPAYISALMQGRASLSLCVRISEDTDLLRACKSISCLLFTSTQSAFHCFTLNRPDSTKASRFVPQPSFIFATSTSLYVIHCISCTSSLPSCLCLFPHPPVSDTVTVVTHRPSSPFWPNQATLSTSGANVKLPRGSSTYSQPSVEPLTIIYMVLCR